MNQLYNNAYNATRNQRQMQNNVHLVFACGRAGISSCEEPPYVQRI